jgi:hypothetical protein
MKVGDRVELLHTDIGNLTKEVNTPLIRGTQGTIVDIRDHTGFAYLIQLSNCASPLFFADDEFKVIEEVINNE